MHNRDRRKLIEFPKPEQGSELNSLASKIEWGHLVMKQILRESITELSLQINSINTKKTPLNNLLRQKHIGMGEWKKLAGLADRQQTLHYPVVLDSIIKRYTEGCTIADNLMNSKPVPPITNKQKSLLANQIELYISSLKSKTPSVDQGPEVIRLQLSGLSDYLDTLFQNMKSILQSNHKHPGEIK